MVKTGWQEDKGQLANATDRSSEGGRGSREPALDLAESIGDLEKDIQGHGEAKNLPQMG